MSRFVDFLPGYIVSWLDSNWYVAIGLAMGVPGIAFVLRATREGAAVQRDALEELQQRVVAQLSNPSRLTVKFLRSSALEIERQKKCAVITDKLICEVIRAVALDLERYVPANVLEARLVHLSTILKALEDCDPPLLSIALVDRLYAYRQAQLFVTTSLLGLQLLVVWLPMGQQVRMVVSLAILLYQLIVALGALRAAQYWKRSRFAYNSIVDVKSNRIFDIFWIACISRANWTDGFWHVAWGPLWEHPIMILRSSGRFAAMHRFRYPVARTLHRRWRRLARMTQEKRMQGLPTEDEQNSLADACQALWIITGDDAFLKALQDGRPEIVSGSWSADYLD